MSDDSNETTGFDEREQSPFDGKTLGPYRLIEEIGQGGQGFVYLAEDLRLGRRIALKILPRGYLHSSDARLRFAREAELASKLDHPGIARVFELGEHEGTPYIAMEYVPGRTLAAHIKEALGRQAMDELATEAFVELGEQFGDAATAREHSRSTRIDDQDDRSKRAAIRGAARYIESAARALHAAHEAGLVHRDVKPGNLIVREDGSACVLDFGLAQDQDAGAEALTRTGDVVGTPAYMSPEQLRLRGRELDRRTDVYSLGVCLFEACTLRRPFIARTSHDLFSAIRQQDPIAPRKLNGNVPKDLDAIILTAIDKDRGRRYATAEQFADDLRRFIERKPVQARPAGPLLRARRWVERNKVVSLLGILVLAAISTAAIVSWRKGEEARRALADYERLADTKRIEWATRAANNLYPPSPKLLPELEAWQREHAALIDRLEDHRAFLTALRQRAKSATISPVSWSFHSSEEQFQHDLMMKLVIDLERFVNDERGPVKSVERRIAQSREIKTITIEEPAAAWSACRERVLANPAYRGLELSPQLGLIPLGPDPDSGFEEFLHWLSHEGATPRRDEIGRIEVTEELGIILVLVPEGRFLMGAQKDDPELPNYDPETRDTEGPVHEVALDAYFLAKYETSQAQWHRLFLDNPSAYKRGYDGDRPAESENPRLPVEQISWDLAMSRLETVGLQLPTEAEWEMAARADRGLLFSGASSIVELDAFANINGAETAAIGLTFRQPDHRDGYPLHAPIGSLKPNVWGFHDMTGNVWEWCLDGNWSYEIRPGKRGCRSNPYGTKLRILRGGSFITPAVLARVATRQSLEPELRDGDTGVRAARSVDP